MKYTFRDTVRRVEERFTSHYLQGVGPLATFHKDSTGWYVMLQDSSLTFRVGKERPDLAAGSPVRITLENIV